MKVILVTGASSGFGKDLTKKLLENNNFKVYACARRVEEMKDLESKGATIGFVDVTEQKSIDKFVNSIIKKEGKIDVLVNNAGFGIYGILESDSIEKAKSLYEVNVFGLMRVTKSVLPHMRSKNNGKIINLSSVAGKMSIYGLGWYSSTKFAVEALTDSLRAEVANYNIDVVAIRPGVVKTGFRDIALKSSDGVNDSYKDEFKSYLTYINSLYDKTKTTTASTVNKIVKVINKNKPKNSYSSTKDSKVILFIIKTLPKKIINKFLKSRFKK
ncbi:MAG: SDR family NAD(P)-dependent oxidoreductase [Mycoplasma sp.]|nr:SDR family NAD(P)-dependent oxidoreductase [Mycoplasma sp.]